MSQHQVHPIVRQIINHDCHVSMTYRAVIRHVIGKLRDGYRTYRGMSKRDRRDFLRQCIAVHCDNCDLYRYVMGSHTATLRRMVKKEPKVVVWGSSVSGKDVCRLMRKHQVTIAELATRLRSTQKRVRQIRERGLQSGLAVRDWVQAITGLDPGPIPQEYRVHEDSEPRDCGHCHAELPVGNLAVEYVGTVFCSVRCCRQSRDWEE